ncbi:MAG TPA: glutamine cyclotransferase [Chromatiaceae bacterium]|jgi:glutamine cyclotransferase|nr:MAG: glutaminyl-peptide cyclotransferase [Thiohalocapsa sp. PB-PSB1]HBG96306.1 glutamine cyclotransferase [Chromatiaceae bacterium]HCS91998.1 glutamine cyclotransferase [Chromatiaceae bacterium]
MRCAYVNRAAETPLFLWVCSWVFAWARSLALAVLTGIAALSVALAWTSSAPVADFRVVASFPHDPTAFTQGLVFHAGELFEGTGLYGQSTLRRVELESGLVQQQIALPKHLFGEGITVWDDEIIQVSWRARLGIRYDRATLQRLGTFRLSGEGWGIAHDGQHWIVSDGSDTLHFLDPATQQEVRRVRVHDGPQAITRLNELEFIDGEIWANIWLSDRLVRISPADGAVIGYVDLSRLWPASRIRDPQAVLNGIAYDAKNRRLFVTGKYWPRLYQIEVLSAD